MTLSLPMNACSPWSPDHYWALGNLAIINRAAGQHEAAGRLVIRRARAHPDSFISQFVAADVASEMGDRRQRAAFGAG